MRGQVRPARTEGNAATHNHPQQGMAGVSVLVLRGSDAPSPLQRALCQPREGG